MAHRQHVDRSTTGVTVARHIAVTAERNHEFTQARRRARYGVTKLRMLFQCMQGRIDFERRACGGLRVFCL